MQPTNVPGKIQTVLGTITPDQLGITLTHEHLLCDFSVVVKHPDTAIEKDFLNKPVTIETLGRINHWFWPNLDDRIMADVNTAINEALIYKEYGGVSIVEATCIGVSRDPIGLARISRSTGLNIIMGCSYYLATTHPSNMDSISEEEIFEEIVNDITCGVDGTKVKSGIIGEVGCSWPLRKNELKSLKASARAQKVTGAPLLIHPGRHETSPLEIIETLEQSGANLDRTVISHIDRTVFHKETLKQILEKGCYVEWDLFGKEQSYFPANLETDMPSDARRIDDISWVISEGYGKKVVIAHDICNKHRMNKYGGHGYAYILGCIVPRMRTRGYEESSIDDILINNPRDLLTFEAAKI